MLQVSQVSILSQIVRLERGPRLVGISRHSEKVARCSPETFEREASITADYEILMNSESVLLSRFNRYREAEDTMHNRSFDGEYVIP